MNSLRATAFHKAQPFLEKFYSGAGMIWEAFPGANIDDSGQEEGRGPCGMGTGGHISTFQCQGFSWERKLLDQTGQELFVR